jgi:hypothetical protein
MDDNRPVLSIPSHQTSAKVPSLDAPVPLHVIDSRGQFLPYLSTAANIHST